MINVKNVFTKQNRALLSELVRTDFKLRYQGSVLGYFWALLRPLFLFAILYAVFGLILRFGDAIPNYPVYLLLGIVLWTFFGDATRQAKSSIVGRGDLIRKIKFPKYIIVISSTISALINAFFNLIVIFIFIIFSGAEIQPIAVILVPLLLIQLYVLSLAVGFFLAAVNIKYRDISHIWDILLQAGFYATPIFYPLSIVAERSDLLASLMIILNPVAQIIQDIRYLLITTETVTIIGATGTAIYYAIPFAMVIIIGIVGANYFRKRSPHFAEEI